MGKRINVCRERRHNFELRRSNGRHQLVNGMIHIIRAPDEEIGIIIIIINHKFKGDFFLRKRKIK